MDGNGYLTDFTKQGTEPVAASFNLNPQAPGQLHRVGGSFPGIDSPLDIQPNNGDGHPGDMNTVWGTQTQSARLGNPGI